MTNQELLNTTAHRPWRIPAEKWKFYQEWNNAVFLHWQVDLTELQKFVPKELEIDLFEGKPWVSIVVFDMEKIRPKSSPSFPPISNFHEINIRTYIKSNDKTGVYFLSIEGGKKLSCKIAKRISELPYRYSKITRSPEELNSANLEFNDQLKIKYSIGSELNEKTDLDKWLTERYALFQDTAKSINTFEIHHLPWSINSLQLDFLDYSYRRFDPLLKGQPAKIHYCKGVKVIAWGKNKLNKSVF